MREIAGGNGTVAGSISTRTNEISNISFPCSGKGAKRSVEFHSRVLTRDGVS